MAAQGMDTPPGVGASEGFGLGIYRPRYSKPAWNVAKLLIPQELSPLATKRAGK